MPQLKFSDDVPPPAAEADAPPLGAKAAGRPRAEDAEARQESLLDTAGALFRDRGYSNVSLETIAREAHVAVRTIYVKFGGKAGLFNAVIARSRALYCSEMDHIVDDYRPIRQILTDFGVQYLELATQLEMINLHRMAIAEARDNPELATTFYEAGPRITGEILAQFFARPDIRAQLRDDVPLDLLPAHLLNCVTGDQLIRMLLLSATVPDQAELLSRVQRGLDLFFRAVLRQPA